MADERNVDLFLCAAGDKILKMLERLGKMLKVLGWPERYITDKIIYDLYSTKINRHGE